MLKLYQREEDRKGKKEEKEGLRKRGWEETCRVTCLFPPLFLISLSFLFPKK
jgi:hypothetical protein